MFHAVWKGGPIVSVLMALILMVIAYIVERIVALNKASGKGSITEFVQSLKQDVDSGSIDQAISRCDDHQAPSPPCSAPCSTATRCSPYTT